MSPVVVLSRYKGGANPDVDRPFWTNIPAGVSVELRQFRLAIADIFIKVAPFQEGVDNDILEIPILEWALAVAYSAGRTVPETVQEVTQDICQPIGWIIE
ncbi:hypothetical protein FIBSPDRAFT_958592 [Athelia psychrophila]|nr:hypothetical protein FIBSPDRAFT_958592 [Fibularhizoctonia sp. CBS 109695]